MLDVYHSAPMTAPVARPAYSSTQASGFRQVTLEVFNKMSEQDKAKYVHQYLQYFPNLPPNLLRVALQQPAKQA